MDNIRIIFVLSEKYNEESEASQTMSETFEQCQQNVSINVSWVKEKNFGKLNLNKTDFVVFEHFEGNLFEQIKETKSARILGPWAVNVCLMEGKQIPNFPWPIYNVAMYDCIVTCSHLSKVLKAEIKEKVEKMGGCCVDTLLSKNTHLITGSAKSEKYLMAAEAGLKLMCPSWIEEVWQISQSINIHANDERFNKHRCLPFQNLVISSTGLLRIAERQKIEKLVTDHGGCFTRKLNLSNTDILVCCGDNCTNSDKYKAARQQKNIKCVNYSWITDSIEKGYALSHTNYQVQKTTSTPTKPDEPVNPEFSMLSAIGLPNMSHRASVDETAVASPFSPAKSNGKRKASVPEYQSLMEALDIKKAKKAGQYLDGCSVYIVGFGSEHTEKLNKIINLSGATRYDSYSERVTHVLVGDPYSHDVRLLKNNLLTSPMVTLQWLLDSINIGRPAPDDNYLLSSCSVDRNDISASPLRKKGLNLLKSERTVTERDFKVNLNESPHFAEPAENDIVQQYLRQNTASQEDTLAKLLNDADNTTIANQKKDNCKIDSNSKLPEISTQDSSVSVTQDVTSEIPQIFQHMKFLLIGFDEEENELLKTQIESFSGELVPRNFKGIADYLVVPIFNDKEIHFTATEVVNNFFIHECEHDEELVTDIAYYHRPYNLPQKKPLQHCVITLSGYGGYERMFLRSLVEVLGGMAQDQFARVTSVAKGVVASTHLVTLEGTGKKYEAALKWGLPVVGKEWLMECYKTEKYISENEYLIGASKAPERKISPTSNVDIPKEQSISNVNMSKYSGTPTASAGPSRVLTPVNQVTPLYKKYMDSAEKPFSQVTPINKIMQNFRESNLLLNTSAPKETKEYKIPEPWMSIKTPETPLGACVTPNPSPRLRKQWEYWLKQFPDKCSPKSTASTPLSEIKRQLWNKVLKKDSISQPNFNNSETEDSNENIGLSSNNEVSDPKTPENQQLVSRLQLLEDMVTASGGGAKRHSSKFQATIPAPGATTEYLDSQPCTVGWDFQDQMPEQPKRIFSLSGIADDSIRANMAEQIEQLGGSVSDLSNYDPTCTHLLCSTPARNEKSLSCMAAGKWVLHISYLKKSVEAGHFLNEEEYEFGNPKAVGNFGVPPDRDTELRMQRMYWWRNEISKRGYRAFNDMRAIVVAQKKGPLHRVIEAGGGTVIDVSPPFEEPVHATHCLLEQKSVQDFSVYVPLAKQGIYLVNTVFVSDFLHNPNKDIRDCILPFFAKFYARD